MSRMSFQSNSALAQNYRQMEALWTALAPLGRFTPTMAMPTIELRETDDAIVVTASLPGIDPDEVDVHASPTSLTFTGQRQTQRQDLYGVSIGYERFQQTIPLPMRVQARPQVAFQQDQIVVTLPKAGWRRGWQATSPRGVSAAPRYSTAAQPITVKPVEAWTLLDEAQYQGKRLLKTWRRFKHWLGQQLRDWGDRLAADR